MTRIRWTIIALFVGAMVLNYLARSVLGVAAPVVLEEQGITSEQYGWITGAFQLGIMLQPLAGYFLDSAGLRIGFAICAAAWSLITMAHVFASGWLSFAALRGLLGLAEGSAQPAGQKLVATWFPARERGTAGGIYNIGASFGAVFAPPLVAWAVLAYSWRAAFVVAGGLGLLWVLLWLFWYESPARHRRIGEGEQELIAKGQEAHLAASAQRPSILSVLRRRNLWGIALPRLLADPVWGMLSFWMPLYLARVHHFDLAQIAIFAWLPFLSADLGCLFGPAVASALHRRGVDLIDARRMAFTLGAVMMTGMAFVGLVSSPYVAIALLCLGGFAHQTLSVTVITMASDLFRRNEVATAASLAGLAANLGVLIFSLLLGGLVDRVGYEPFFIVLGLLDMRGDPDSCGVWAPDLTYAHGRFWLMFTDVKRYGQTTVNGATGASLRDFHNYVVTATQIDGEWSDPVHLNSSGFDPSLFHDNDGRSWLVNMLWDHRPGRSRFGGIVVQELDRQTMRLVGKRHLVFEGTERGFTEAPHLYKRDGWYHLLVAEGGTGWDHAVVMARSRNLFGPYEVHPDGAVLTAAGHREGHLTRAGHGDLVDLPDGSTWIAYLCGRPLPGFERCVLGRETAVQPMVWGDDGWLRTLAGDGIPDPAPSLPPLQAAPEIADADWDGGFETDALPLPLQWLRSPRPERLFSLSARPGWLRLFGRETVGSFFEQALVARRQEHFAFEASTLVEFDPQDFQQSAGLICYYNSSKFHYLNVTVEGESRQLQVLSAVPNKETAAYVVADDLPGGPIELRVEVSGADLRFSWRCGGDPWHEWPVVLDASVLSDEVSLPGLPNFTGTFVGVAAQDLSGDGAHADFRFLRYCGKDKA